MTVRTLTISWLCLQWNDKIFGWVTFQLVNKRSLNTIEQTSILVYTCQLFFAPCRITRENIDIEILSQQIEWQKNVGISHHPIPSSSRGWPGHPGGWASGAALQCGGSGGACAGRAPDRCPKRVFQTIWDLGREKHAIKTHKNHPRDVVSWSFLSEKTCKTM